MLQKHTDRIPVVCEKSPGCSVPDIDKSKYLVPKEFTIQQFTYIIRKRLKLEKEQALWLFVNGKHALKGDMIISSAYEKFKDNDGFLYVAYSGENVYGSY